MNCFSPNFLNIWYNKSRVPKEMRGRNDQERFRLFTLVKYESASFNVRINQATFISLYKGKPIQ